MKKTVYIAMLAVLSLLVFSPAKAQSGLGFNIGLSTPNDQINNVYNDDNLGSLGQLWREGSKLGWNLGVTFRLPMTENVVLKAGVAWHKFPETKIEVKDPNNQATTLATLTTTQNIFPINAGINFYLFRSLLSLYGTGDLAYNYISNSLDVQYQDQSIPGNPFDVNPDDSRIGAGIGVGADLDIKILLLNLEAKYNWINLIGMEDNEETKSYFSLTLGVYFGGLMPI